MADPVSQAEVDPAGKKKSPAGIGVRILGVCVCLLGLVQFINGVDKVRGGTDAVLLQESDSKFEAAKKLVAEAESRLQSLVDDATARGLEAVRTDKAAETTAAADGFGAAVAKLRSSADDIESFRRKNPKNPVDGALRDKGEASRQFADGYEIAREITLALLDPAHADVAQFLAAIEPLVEKRNAVLEAAVTLSKKADEAAGTPRPGT